ncbi:MAG: family 16 glycoside hydrolase [Kiritimatiellia bacterium]
MKKTMFAIAAMAAVTAFAEVPYNIGVAGFTFHRKSLDETLEIMQKADAHYLCVKDFHLKLDSNEEQIAAFKAKCAEAKVVPYAVGPLYCKDADEVRRHFEYARRLGVKTIVGVPYDPGDEKDSWGKRKGSRRMLLEIDKLVKEFDIRYAIHNHGPSSPDMYPDVAYGWELVKELDGRIGFCMDIGWEWASGHDPAETVRRHGGRIFDIHVKNFDPAKKNWSAVPLPRGRIDLVKVFTALAEVGYDGVCSLEYERDFNDNLLPITESVAYMRGIADTIKAPPKMMPAPALANTLTEAEKAEGWRLLWDGRTSAGWVSAQNTAAFPEKGWVMKDGTLTMLPVKGISPDRRWFALPPEDQKLGGGGDIVTVAKYRDFAFKFDFRLTRAANSGVKYFFDENQNGGTCEEYQILENDHPDSDKGRQGNRKAASLYDILPADADSILKGAGQWNTGMIVAKGAHVEHWLNGVKVLEYERGSEAFKAAVKASKYAKWGKSADGKAQDWGEIPEGRILLQDHSDSTVSFCNLKIKKL